MFVVIPSEAAVLVPIALQFLLNAALVLAVELITLAAPCNSLLIDLKASYGATTVNHEPQKTTDEATVAYSERVLDIFLQRLKKIKKKLNQGCTSPGRNSKSGPRNSEPKMLTSNILLILSSSSSSSLHYQNYKSLFP
jgi:hypothetical protein